MPPRPAYVIGNLLDNATLSATSEDPVYTLDFLHDRILARRFQFTSTTGGTIDIDFGSPRTFDFVGLMNHNLTADATISIRAGNDLEPATIIDAPDWAPGNIGSFPETTTARFLRIVITDSNAFQVGLGQLVAGVMTELPRAPRYGREPGEEHRDIADRTYAGVIPGPFSLYRLPVRRYDFLFPQAEYAGFKALHDAVDGIILPFVWIEGREGSGAWAFREPLYVRKEPSFAPRESTIPTEALLWEYRLELTGESPGVDILR